MLPLMIIIDYSKTSVTTLNFTTDRPIESTKGRKIKRQAYRKTGS